jgi:hypothetical protein
MHRKISVVLQAYPIGQLIHGYIFMGHDLNGPLKPGCAVNSQPIDRTQNLRLSISRLNPPPETIA